MVISRPLICFIHLLRSMASSLFNLCAWQSFSTMSTSFLWSTSWPGTLHFILHTFLHPIIVSFSQHMSIPSQPIMLSLSVKRQAFHQPDLAKLWITVYTCMHACMHACTHARTHAPVLRASGLSPVLPRWADTRTNLDFTEARDSERSGISWAICNSAPCSRKTTMPAPHHSLFYRPDALPTQPVASKWHLFLDIVYKSQCAVNSRCKIAKATRRVSLHTDINYYYTTTFV